MHEQIRRIDNGAIDYDFYRARAQEARQKAWSGAIRALAHLVRRTMTGPFSFHSLAAAQL
jgi:hypothetical protein